MRAALFLPLACLTIWGCPQEDEDPTPEPEPTPVPNEAPVIESMAFDDEGAFGNPLFWSQDQASDAFENCEPAVDANCYRGLQIEVRVHDEDENQTLATFLLEALDGDGGTEEEWNFQGEAPASADIRWTLQIQIGHPTHGLDPSTPYTFRCTVTDDGGEPSEPFEAPYTTPGDY